MDMKLNEAIDLLSKWQVESRSLHCVVVMGRQVNAKLLGHIDSVNNNVIRVSQSKTRAPLGEKTFIEFSASDSEVIEYTDAAHMKESVLSTMKGHDAVLTATYRSGVIVGLDVLAPLDELLNI
jgi:hypothetical protein